MTDHFAIPKQSVTALCRHCRNVTWQASRVCLRCEERGA